MRGCQRKGQNNQFADASAKPRTTNSRMPAQSPEQPIRGRQRTVQNNQTAATSAKPRTPPGNAQSYKPPPASQTKTPQISIFVPSSTTRFAGILKKSVGFAAF